MSHTHPASASGKHDPHGEPHVVGVGTYLVVFAILMVFMVATVAAAQVNLGGLNPVIMMTIAVTKATLVVLYFMHVRWNSRLTWVYAGAGFLWLGILIALTLADYATRGWKL